MRRLIIFTYFGTFFINNSLIILELFDKLILIEIIVRTIVYYVIKRK